MSYTAWYAEPKDHLLPEKTDKTRWRLTVDRGRQVWTYINGTIDRAQTVYEKYFLGLDISDECPDFPEPETAEEAASNAISFYSKLQTPDGHWANDYGGPLFLMPGLVITAYISGTELPAEYKREMICYLSNVQRDDGGWGLHVECHSTIFGTSLNYTTMRLLGVDKDDPRAVRARNFLRANGGALGNPQWGKFWLSALGVYEYDGMNPVPPELWLLPKWLALNPGNWWCHCRVVFLGMSYVYGSRSVGPLTPLVRELREELYVSHYDEIQWPTYRNYVSQLDMYHPHSWFHNVLFTVCTWYERFRSSWIRNIALAETLDHIRSEDVNTKWIDIGPVNKAMNMLSIFHAEGNKSENFKKHQDRLKDYLWISADGMKMQGYNGSQLWDTAFSVQAIVETGLLDQAKDCLTQAEAYIDLTQTRENVADPEKYYRHISNGAWPFSTNDHGWPISDCTAEGLRAALDLHTKCDWLTKFPEQRYFDAVNVILSLQNKSGGWATYELNRAGSWLELINAAEVFDSIMVEYDYVECSGSCIQALAAFQKVFPKHRAAEIKKSIKRGCDFIMSIQKADGGWLGKWAVCHTYGTWFGVRALYHAGLGDSVAVERAVAFLLQKQKPDGSWSEDFQSCVQYKYIELEKGQVVQTAWALLALMMGNCPDKAAVERGIKYLMSRQLRNGDWPQEKILGVFNANCAISYSGYKNFFPIWALGMYRTYSSDQ